MYVLCMYIHANIILRICLPEDINSVYAFTWWLCAQMDNNVVVSDYSQMDRVLREESQYILDICKTIKKAGCNVLLIQKSILR